MKPWLQLVMAGVFMHSAFESLYQDALGLDKYQALVQNGWVSAKWTVPIALICLICSWCWVAEAKKKIGEI